jgi:hypothetical protein
LLAFNVHGGGIFGGCVYNFGREIKENMSTRATQQHSLSSRRTAISWLLDYSFFPSLGWLGGKWCDTLFLIVFWGGVFWATFDGGMLYFLLLDDTLTSLRYLWSYVYTFLEQKSMTSVC